VVYAPLLKQLLRLKNARWVSVHEVDIPMSHGKLVPLGRLQEIEIEIIHNNTGKLNRLLSIGPLYLAIQDL
jgi:hypothetical protein